MAATTRSSKWATRIGCPGSSRRGDGDGGDGPRRQLIAAIVIGLVAIGVIVGGRSGSAIATSRRRRRRRHRRARGRLQGPARKSADERLRRGRGRRRRQRRPDPAGNLISGHARAPVTQHRARARADCPGAGSSPVRPARRRSAAPGPAPQTTAAPGPPSSRRLLHPRAPTRPGGPATASLPRPAEPRRGPVSPAAHPLPLRASGAGAADICRRLQCRGRPAP